MTLEIALSPGHSFRLKTGDLALRDEVSHDISLLPP